MSRVKFEKGKQKVFFEQVAFRSDLSWSEIASECSVCSRTVRDWRNEKYLADYSVVAKLSKKYGIPLGGHKKVDTYWYTQKGASLGGRACYDKYGLLGTEKSRKRGGEVSQARRRDDPEKYRKLGCNVRKTYKKPCYSEKLAEVVGILMGDGAINNCQVRVSLNRTTDKEYARYVSELIGDTLGERPSWVSRNNVIELTLSGVGLVEVLEELGLKRGDKVVNKIQIPGWIFRKKVYQRACLRGLFDTDGSIYKHVKAKDTYIGWTFTSHISPLLEGAAQILDSDDIKCAYNGRHSLYIYKLEDIVKFMDVVKSSNPKHLKKVEEYKKRRNLEGCTEW